MRSPFLPGAFIILPAVPPKQQENRQKQRKRVRRSMAMSITLSMKSSASFTFSSRTFFLLSTLPQVAKRRESRGLPK
ncbi:hypothetical protein OPV22_016291 [Ensete ventricosum]|uniref:Uncharacterized protein n=1 Tax=Ensete ventricosum TaxID=4639 RepID=A0AAV8PDW6_ENSVE|nr:hypothetical protein OPV22_016291 [Ensete ventricosum]